MEEQFIFPIDKMVGEFDDFIGIWRNFVPTQLCDDVIEKVDHILEHSADTSGIGDGHNQFPNKKMGRGDAQVFLNDYDTELTDNVNGYLRCCLKHYCVKYSQLLNVKLMSHTVKAQKTPPEGGYHEWHYENASHHTATRELVWTIYLNDMPDGEAETEFLYQHRRIKPEKGMMCIFPAGLTHVHRGNTVFSQDKYILTGWALKVQ
tara:strand:+ start:1321 stop:1935 length:615 start_codon:yes stop_codon:yes gene_type:complete